HGRASRLRLPPPALARISCRFAFRPAFAGHAARAERTHHLRQHRNGDLGGARSAYVEADRCGDALDLLRLRAEGEQTLDALGMRLPAAQRADVEAARVERGLQREIVDL